MTTEPPPPIVGTAVGGYDWKRVMSFTPARLAAFKPNMMTAVGCVVPLPNRLLVTGD